MLPLFGIVASSFIAKNMLQKSRKRFRNWVDGVARRLLFQSKRETERTRARAAFSLIRELSIRVYSRFMTHNIMSVAGASAFFIVLAIFPGLAGFVALYGLLGDPADISTFITSMPSVIPPDVTTLIQNFLERLSSRSYTNLSALMIAFAAALWSANSAMKSLVESLNIVYERTEKRSFIQLNILATLMTATFTLFVFVSVNILILPVWDWLLGTVFGELLRLRWILLLIAVQALISALYYYAPCGRQRNWHLFTAGAGVAALAWVITSMGFSVYLNNFANYSVTYGSLGAIAIFMTWLWLTVMILLLGAEIDAAITALGAKDE